jgi:uncharacterized membrane protein YeaQ/YmgE (transglycosylase-associated protein family)
MIDILISLIIAGIAGAIAKSLVGLDRGGCIISIVVGFIGAMIGTWLAREFNLPDLIVFHLRGTEYHILWTIIGAVIFTAVLSLISPGKKK